MAAQRTTKLKFELSLLLCNSLAVYAMVISRRTLCVVLISASKDLHVCSTWVKYRNNVFSLHTTTTDKDKDRPNQDSIFNDPSWMSTPIQIPRPTWPPRRSLYGTTHGKVDTMGSSEGIPKERAMATAPRLKLDTLAGPQAQDVRKWMLLVDECVQAFPALGDSARRWPVEFYYTQYTYWRGMHWQRRQKAPTAAAPSNIIARLGDARAEFEEAQGTPGFGARREGERGRERLGAGSRGGQCHAGCIADPWSDATVTESLRWRVAKMKTQDTPLRDQRYQASVSSSQIASNTSAPASSLVPSGHNEDPQRRVAKTITSSGSGQMPSNATQRQLQFQPRDRRNIPNARWRPEKNLAAMSV
ncbi:hypothetical protein DFH09DRAFT_1073145 [Mycena vulgaris]|nr:hypothetical protein DFH09DRAFT_1073145 [Mycena vulgaris]